MQPTSKPIRAGVSSLTPREREVTGYLLHGCANKVIAMDLGISLRTVEAHRARIFDKLGVRHAVALAHLFYRLNEPDLTARYLAVQTSPQLQLGNAAEDSSSMGSRSG